MPAAIAIAIVAFPALAIVGAILDGAILGARAAGRAVWGYLRAVHGMAESALCLLTNQDPAGPSPRRPAPAAVPVAVPEPLPPAPAPAIDPVPVAAAETPAPVEYQCWASAADGSLLHCGPRTLSTPPDQAWADAYVLDWERWADGIASQSPGCPTAESRRRTATVVAYPVGRPEDAQRFDVSSLALPPIPSEAPSVPQEASDPVPAPEAAPTAESPAKPRQRSRKAPAMASAPRKTRKAKAAPETPPVCWEDRSRAGVLEECRRRGIVVTNRTTKAAAVALLAEPLAA